MKHFAVTLLALSFAITSCRVRENSSNNTSSNESSAAFADLSNVVTVRVENDVVIITKEIKKVDGSAVSFERGMLTADFYKAIKETKDAKDFQSWAEPNFVAAAKKARSDRGFIFFRFDKIDPQTLEFKYATAAVKLIVEKGSKTLFPESMSVGGFGLGLDSHNARRVLGQWKIRENSDIFGGKTPASDAQKLALKNYQAALLTIQEFDQIPSPDDAKKALEKLNRTSEELFKLVTSDSLNEQFKKENLEFKGLLEDYLLK